ncbi:sigma factor-like helix-turn-helix DNA-binding protein [Neobittarella massiliensis]|uniref:sigma factor-like helix-turn-helix DNA-binding protein n=1 Tax=Neobittarella massiliensis (ex Bilen et al. 2018) TaxID=2041842 RepID=UPI0013EB5E93|nr:sigma factor-like helix-turn-helix DNA-binding protein [Neobittarella massiliensis]
MFTAADQLSQLPHLRREIGQLQRRIETLRDQAVYTADRVQSSQRQFPYRAGTVRIVGLDMQHSESRRYQQQIAGLLAVLRQRQRRLLQLAAALEKQIAALPDSRHRQVLTLRFIEGLTAAQTAQVMDYSHRQVDRLQKEAAAQLRR